MAPAWPQSQLPVLCRACGGPVTPGADDVLRCPYCGTEDRLPQRELERVLELKRRVKRAASAALQLSGTQAAQAHIFESRGAFLRVSAPYLVIAVLITVQQAFSAWPTIVKAPPELRGAMVLYATMGSLFVSGLALAFVVALAVGRVGYRRSIRPLLLGRPPREPGLPARCRGCGAELRDERGPFIRCEYCQTHNLVTPELQVDAHRLLEAEERAFRAKTISASAGTTRTAQSMTRALVVGVVVAYASIFAIASLATRLLPH